MILDMIVAQKKEEVAQRKQRTLSIRALKRNAAKRTAVRNFEQALMPGNGAATRIIAEIKKASPSKGVIRENCDPGKMAAVFESAGAAAISVLTESTFFKGNIYHLTLVRRQVSIPILCKDFIIDPYQIYEAALLGADAVLLIASLLSQQQLEEFLYIAKELHMGALVEVHNEDDLEKALLTPALVIGINNRNLDTFATDINTTLQLIAAVPEGIVVVSESGIKIREHIKVLKKAGAHVFLIGESLMKEYDPGKKLRELRGCQ